MHHAVAVRIVETGACLPNDVERLLDIEASLVAQELCARLSGDVLHDDEVLTRGGVDPGVVYLNDIRVHEPPGGDRLALEARDERRILRKMLGQQLDRDVAL